jgi:hypothetical protein
VAISYVLDRDRRRVRARAEGLVTCAEFVAHFSATEPDRAAGYDELFDATGATTDLTADQVRALALRAQALRQKGPLGAVAVVATNDLAFGLARMYGLLCETVGAPAGAFRTAAKAEEWLDRRSAASRGPKQPEAPRVAARGPSLFCLAPPDSP